MNFEAPKAALSAALALACRVVPGKPSIPILKCLIIDAHEDEGVFVAATDLSTSVRIHVPGAIVREPGTVALRAVFPSSYTRVDRHGAAEGEMIGFPRATLAQYFDVQDGDHVEAHVEGPDLVTTCGRTTSQFRTLPAIDYPIIPELDPNARPAFETSAGQFTRLMKCAGHAALEDQTRPVLTSICLSVDSEEGAISACSSDGFRFATAGTKDLACYAPESFQVLLPPDLLDLTAQIPADDLITFTMAHGHVYVEAPGVFLVSVPMGGEYPDMQSIVTAYTRVQGGVVAKTRDLTQALRGIGGLADSQAGGAVALRLTADGLTVSTGGTAPSSAGAASVTVPGDVRLDDEDGLVEVDVKLQFLREILRAVPSEDHVCLEVRTRSSGATMLFVTDPVSGADRLAVIAPMRRDVALAKAA